MLSTGEEIQSPCLRPRRQIVPSKGEIGSELGTVGGVAPVEFEGIYSESRVGSAGETGLDPEQSPEAGGGSRGHS